MKMMRELRKQVEQNADYVGDQFAEEARRIHYNEAEKRGIYGEATREDAEALVEEGHRGTSPAGPARRRELTSAGTTEGFCATIM